MGEREGPLPAGTSAIELYDKYYGSFSYFNGESNSSVKLQRYLESPEAGAELQSFKEAVGDGVLRVIVVRHGFGEHNRWYQLGSLAHRDARLDDIGKAEAEIVGRAMAEVGIIELLDLAVISPFRRTLETAQNLLAGAIGVDEEQLLRQPMCESRKSDTSHKVKTLIQPLCAEDTMSRAAMLQGNLGSPAADLKQQYPMFDFSPLEEYCEDDGTDEWWRHHNGASSYETQSSFEQRVIAFRQWLAMLSTSTGISRAIIISHGGFLETCFGYAYAPNCGFRTYDVFSDSSIVECCPATERPSTCRSAPCQE